MTLLLSWHYGRLWPIEVCRFLEARSKHETIKVFKPDLNFNRDRFGKAKKNQSDSAGPRKGKGSSRIDNGKDQGD